MLDVIEAFPDAVAAAQYQGLQDTMLHDISRSKMQYSHV
jgi:hypothetical protein